MSGSAPRLSLTKLYEQRARECALAAEGTDKPKDRERLLKWADEWRRIPGRRTAPRLYGNRGRGRAFRGGPRANTDHAAVRAGGFGRVFIDGQRILDCMT